MSSEISKQISVAEERLRLAVLAWAMSAHSYNRVYHPCNYKGRHS